MAEQGEPPAIVVEGITQEISPDMLIKYFERCGGSTINDVIFDSFKGSALVQFAEEDITGNVSAQVTHFLKQKALRVRRAEPHELLSFRLIWVQGLPHDVTEECLILFFDNKRRCHGGVVKTVEIRTPTENSKVARVEFSEPKG